MQRRSALNSALALAALAVGLEPLLVRQLGSHAPAWSHWWCSASSASPTSASAISHISGGGSGGLGGGLHWTFALLAVHWPHFLPIVLALSTIAYLWRADAQFRADQHKPMRRSASLRA